jgi:chromosome partitioning protein
MRPKQCSNDPSHLTESRTTLSPVNAAGNVLLGLVAGERRRIMHSVVLATQKGGSGKSTLAVGLAVAAMEDEHRVALIETDQQGTVLSWGRRRVLAEPRVERVGSSLEMERALRFARRDGVTLAVIDTPATINDLSSSAIRAADLCLIPTRPSPADIEATLPTLNIVRKLCKPFAFVLNQAPPRGYRPSEAAAALNAAGVLALPIVVHRHDHQDALGAGFGVTEFAPQGKAAEEIQSLWRWVRQKLLAEKSDRGRAPIKATG